MTNDRKSEVNRRLFEYEFPDTLEGRLADAGGAIDAVRRSQCWPSDYTADLNALARLEAKMPMHGWVMNLIGQGETAGAFVTLHANNGEEWGETVQPTEAEARAEAICQYLESL